MISILFTRTDSVYKSLDVDVWDKERNATYWPGGNSLVAHPPCAQWGRLYKFANVDIQQKRLGNYAAAMVRRFGGVLEHPAFSKLWKECELPVPGKTDSYGGWTMVVDQVWFGHKAKKRTWLYIVGCQPCNLPGYQMNFQLPSHVIESRKLSQRLPSLSKADREHTPLEMAKWLIQIARNCAI